MSSLAVSHRSAFANAIYGLLNLIPFGFFVAALIFDIIYANTAVVMWGKGDDPSDHIGLRDDAHHDTAGPADDNQIGACAKDLGRFAQRRVVGDRRQPRARRLQQLLDEHVFAAADR